MGSVWPGRDSKSLVNLCILVFLVLLTSVSAAADPPDLEARVLELEKQAAASAASGSVAPPPPSAPRAPFTISGFLKTDFLYGDARVNSTDAPRFALSETASKGTDDFFAATVQHSRLIGTWAGPELWGGALGGVAEVDFFTLNDTGDSKFNNAQLRARQLFAELRSKSWSVKVGQAWDIFSPLNPTTFNTNGNYWFGGNAGFRRPQIAGEATLPLGDHELTLAGSVNANIGRTDTIGGRTVNSGEDAGIPVFEGSLTAKLALLPAGPLTITASGLWGEEDLEGLENGIDQWAVGISVILPILNTLSLRGEAQIGENTDAFLMGGGIASDGDPVSAGSGWAEISFKATPDLVLTALYGLEDLSRSEVSNAGRQRNQLFGASVKYSVLKALTLAAEYTHFDTDFRSASDANANLLWWSLIFNL